MKLARHPPEHKDWANQLPPLKNYETPITLFICYRRKRERSKLRQLLILMFHFFCRCASSACLHISIVILYATISPLHRSRTIEFPFWMPIAGFLKLWIFILNTLVLLTLALVSSLYKLKVYLFLFIINNNYTWLWKPVRAVVFHVESKVKCRQQRKFRFLFFWNK